MGERRRRGAEAYTFVSKGVALQPLATRGINESGRHVGRLQSCQCSAADSTTQGLN